MLNKNHLSRYSKFGQISSHIWFQNFNWEDLISMNTQPAFVPQIQSKEDNGQQIPYIDFIKTKNKEWVPPEDQQPVDKKAQDVFKEWLKNF